MTDIQVGHTYQSRGFPHISRKVLRINEYGVVYYSIINDRHPAAQFRKLAAAPLTEFKKVSVLEPL